MACLSSSYASSVSLVVTTLHSLITNNYLENERKLQYANKDALCHLWLK